MNDFISAQESLNQHHLDNWNIVYDSRTHQYVCTCNKNGELVSVSGITPLEAAKKAIAELSGI